LVDDEDMSVRGLAPLVTCVIVVVLAVVFGVLSWGEANKVATSVSALAGVAAVGVAVWAAWAGEDPRGG
jgi:membrane protein YdbS with pleckstrin-like domain